MPRCVTKSQRSGAVVIYDPRDRREPPGETRSLDPDAVREVSRPIPDTFGRGRPVGPARRQRILLDSLTHHFPDRGGVAISQRLRPDRARVHVRRRGLERRHRGNPLRALSESGPARLLRALGAGLLFPAGRN